MSEEGFEGESTAAYKSRVHLEDPIEMLMAMRTIGNVTYIQVMFFPSYHVMSSAKYLRSKKT